MKLSVDIQAYTHPALRQSFWQRLDLRNMALLLVGFAAVLVLVPPVRSSPTDDDWVYSRSVQDILSGHYKLPGATATALGHTAWGALVSWLFGFNFTTLSLVSVVAAASCLVLLYVLLRQLGVTSGYSLLGTALLGCNPIFVYLSYSFMTDITFLAYMLAACVCFFRAFHDHSLKWLLLASIVTSLAYMTRQFGILLVPVALIYLWWSREWRWRDVFAVTVLPVATALVYFLWEHSQPVPIAAYFAASERAIAMSDLTAYAIERSQAFALILATLGLSLAPLVRFPKHPLLSLPVLACIVAFQVRSTYLAGSPFPVSGNILDNTGFMSCCNSSPIWSLSVWLIIGIVGATIISLYLVGLAEQLSQWLHTGPWRNRTADPLFFVYLLGCLLAAGTVAVGLNAPFM